MHKSSSIRLHYHYLNSSFAAVQKIKIEHQNKFEYFEPTTSSSKYHQLFNELDEKWCTVFFLFKKSLIVIYGKLLLFKHMWLFSLL